MSSSAVEILRRQEEGMAHLRQAHRRLQPVIERLWRRSAANRRYFAIHLGILTPPRTGDMGQMVDDLTRTGAIQ